MCDLDVNLDADGTWLCRHVDASESPAPPTRLSFGQTVDEFPGRRTSVPRRMLRCPDCGTLWRVWVPQRFARPYIDSGPAEQGFPLRLRRQPLRDIDRVIDLVREKLPDVIVEQHRQTWPADDDGLWWFRLSDVRAVTQLESSHGSCPFLFEYDDMQSTFEARKACTIEEAAREVTNYLAQKQAGQLDCRNE